MFWQVPNTCLPHKCPDNVFLVNKQQLKIFFTIIYYGEGVNFIVVGSKKRYQFIIKLCLGVGLFLNIGKRKISIAYIQMFECKISCIRFG